MIFVLTRCAFYVAAFVGSWMLPPADEPAMVDVNGRQAVAMHWRWDAIYYYDISVDGYEEGGRTAYFPAFPVVVRAVSFVLAGFRLPDNVPIHSAGRAPLLAGILVAHAMTFVAFLLLFALARDHTGDDSTAGRTVLYASLYPWSYHYATPYTEGLFLAASVGAFFAMRRQRWLLAGALIALASATRVVGILLIVPLAIELALAWRRGQLPRPALLVAGLGLLVGPSGLMAFMGYLWWRFGDPLAFLAAQEDWGRERTSPLTTLVRGVNYAIHRGWTAEADVYARGVIHAAFTFALLAILIVAARHLPLSWVVYAALVFLIVLSSPVRGPYTTHDLGRHLMILFPVYVVLGRWGRFPAVNLAIMLLFVPLFSLFAAFYVRWYPA